MHILASSGPELSLQTIYESCIPSIVSITAFLDGESYYWGTGIILTQDGFVITNAHVLEGTSSVTVALWDDREFEAKLVGSDSLSDLAVLKIEATDLAPAAFGDSDALRVGDRVAAIGNPLGEELRGTMTDGIVSAINRGIEYDGHTLTLIQTNAALNEGNSGGSLINMYGQVVGITNMKMSSSFSSIEGLGFAIPTQSMKDVVDALIADGRVLGRPALGITVGSVPKEAADYYTMPEGVYIESVSEKSDAYTKGIRHGDIITAVNGTAITAADEINEIKNTLSVGDSMTLTIYRDGESHDVTVVLMDAGDVY
jgi:serine protease Do